MKKSLTQREVEIYRQRPLRIRLATAAAVQSVEERSLRSTQGGLPDEATRELMVDFYRRLWVEKKPKWQALWEAKKRIRETKDERGQPKYSTRDWAAWVLTGDPN